MLVLENASLRVTLLDPHADRDRLSIRYCCGGYIFQVEDKQLGPLLAIPDQLTDEQAKQYSNGKVWEDGFNIQDGQGIPDCFSGHGRPNPEADGTMLVLGVGVCTGKKVDEWAEWEVVQSSPTSYTFTTNHDCAGHQPMKLVRTVRLEGRTVRSETHLVNTGGATVPVCWYPHPFFPQSEGDELLKFSTPVTLPADSAGYELSPSGWVSRKGWPWTGKDNFYQALGHSGDSSFVVLHRHPKVGMIAGSIDYVPGLLPIWGNPRTISWEPHLERTLASGQDAKWAVEYEFGGGMKM